VFDTRARRFKYSLAAAAAMTFTRLEAVAVAGSLVASALLAFWMLMAA